MIIKKLLVFLILVVLSGSCSVTRRSIPDVFKITVINKNNNSPIDSARVILTSVTESRNINEYVRYTDAHGQCSFSQDHNPLVQFQVRAMKKGYTSYFDSSYTDLDRAISFINEKTGNIIVLNLTSDTLNHENYWASHSIRFNIDTLINILKSNAYPLRSEFPELVWADIPQLLAIGNNKSLINKYPISVLSSSYTKECYLGIVSLWFIESSRITELKKTNNPSEKFPSKTPTLYQTGNPAMKSNSIEIMEKACQAYRNWWNQIKNMDKEQGCKINPLINSNLEWRD